MTHQQPLAFCASRELAAYLLLVELSPVGRSEHSDDPTQLNSTQQSEFQS